MDALINFKYNGHLRVCASDEFNVTIMNTLSNILVSKLKHTDFFYNCGVVVRKL